MLGLVGNMYCIATIDYMCAYVNGDLLYAVVLTYELN